ncbi:MAG: DUF4345 domain-containing protein [Rhizobiaceae bacterium]
MKLGLQIVAGILSLIPGFFGIYNAWIGTARFLPQELIDPGLDSQFRYQSGVYFGLAVLIWWLIPRIDRETTVFRIVILAVFLGGVARLISYLTVGPAGAIPFGSLILELCLPVLIIWQNAIRQR